MLLASLACAIAALASGSVTACPTAAHPVDADAYQWSLPRFSDDAAALYKAASSFTAAAGSEVLVLDDEESYVFDNQGKSVHVRYILFKVLTQKGADGWSSISAEWEPWHEERPAIRARVITSDGSIHPLDPTTMTDAPTQDDDDSDVYTDRRVMRAPLPAMLPGSVVEEEDIWTENKPLFHAGTVHRFWFGRVGVPVANTRLTLDAPASLELRYDLQMLPDLKPVRSEEDGRQHLIFAKGFQRALEEPEKHLPSDEPAYPGLAFSTASSWQQMAEEY
jgi:hypothetical protein